MFADRAKIFVRSGKGGDGHVSFRRELYVPNGGPDGGDGGDGGNVVFVVDRGLNTLTDFRNIRKYKAEDGEEGRKRNCHGANGKDVVLSVPPGTVIRDFDTGKVILDMADRTEPAMVEAGEKTVLACAERLGVSGVITAAKADVLERCRLHTPTMTVKRYMAPEWMEEV